MEPLSFIFLHGFLGRPADWDFVSQKLILDLGAKVTAVDYFSNPSLSPKNKLTDWGKNFNQWVQQNLGVGPHILVGYSMGGRLGLHALEVNPSLYKMGFFVSVNPGFSVDSSSQERDLRLQSDLVWSNRFLHDPWEKVLEDWNNQDVFKKSKAEPRRDYSDYRRDLLAKALTNWSLAKQKDFRPYLLNPGLPIAWMVGEVDAKYMKIAKNMLEICPQLNYQVVPNSGHRIQFDNPDAFAKMISASAKNLLKTSK